MQTRISCPVYPTENPEKIRDALTSLFPNEAITVADLTDHSCLELFLSERKSLNVLRNLIHQLHIIDVVRSILLSKWTGTATSLYLDKQAALIEKIRVVDYPEIRPPLGCITLQFIFHDQSEFNSFIHWFTPPTRDGAIVID